MRDEPFDDVLVNTPFDTAIEALTTALLLVLPLAYGGVDAWGQEIWMALVVGMGLCTLAKLTVYRQAASVRSWTYVPIVYFWG